ncbi:MAG TPA: hypothetical protein VNJ49_02905 [Bradyrhizobium sp.]|nr:hypothetical protein [Bradyrhizobium sp.]
MLPLAKFWTWLGNYFLPVAVAWGYFVRSGSDEGVRISRGYWGLTASLLVGSLLTVALAMYVQEAKRAKAIRVPPNTAFEGDADRNLVISWGTIATYFLAVLVSVITFGTRYADSKIHAWDKTVPLADSFWGSRVLAWTQSCSKSSCYSMGNRFDAGGKELEFVDQYIPYLTDPAVFVLGLLFIASLVALLMTILNRSSASQG